MKQSKLVIILLAILVISGWGYLLLGNDTEAQGEYEGHISTATDYMKRGLYQKAIEEYDKALSIINTEDLWTAKLEAYKKRYEESTKVYNEYLTATRNAVSQYSKNVDFVLTLVDLYMIKDEYTLAYRALKGAVDAGLDDDRVEELLLDVKYSYEIGWKIYDDYLPYSNGYYAVRDADTWTYIEANGSDTDFDGLVFAGCVGESGIRVVQDEHRAYLVDEREVVQGILGFAPSDAGVYSEGFVAIRDDESYSYYNSLGDRQFGDYDNAGTFVDGIAAVQKHGAWHLINTIGQRVSEDEYEDIILQANGSHLYDGIMIAKKDGTYKIYKDGDARGDYQQADILTDDDMIAACVDGQWGFVDSAGIERIAPMYEGAKNFSHGLAAVCDGEKWGFIDTDGHLVIDYIFYGVDYFNEEGYCMVQTSAGDTWQLLSLYIK